jgi:nicotinate-nucleotide adenylyltransferase
MPGTNVSPARIAIFGGSFNPPHLGHEMAMLYVLATAGVDELLMMPCFRHPFEKQLVPFEHRLAMCERAIEPLGRRVAVSDLEYRLGGESRTLNTVKALRAERPGARVVVVVGSDLVTERERWYGWSELSALVEFVVVGRAGSGVGTPAGPAERAEDTAPPLQIPNISSSEVRDRLARGQSVATWVPASVLEYIAAHGLYREAPPP